MRLASVVWLAIFVGRAHASACAIASYNLAGIPQHHEIELKYSLKKSGFNDLKKVLSGLPSSTKNYRNFYFDTEDHDLKGDKITLRLRKGDEDAFVTLKLPTHLKMAGKARPKVKIEIETQIPLATAEQILAGTIDILDLHDVPTIEALRRIASEYALNKLEMLHASVDTQRTTYSLPDGHQLELDSFTILEDKYYEVELELSENEDVDDLHDSIVKYFEKADAKWDFSEDSKSSKLFHASNDE